MSDANTTRFTIVAESTPGVTPTNPAWSILRTTGSTLGPQNQTLQSREVRADRNPAGAKLGSPASGGSLPFELHYGPLSHALLMLASIQGGTAAADTLVASVTASSNTLSKSGLVASLAAEVGDILQIADGSTIDTYRRVVSVATDDLVFAGSTISGTVTVRRGARAKNGVTPVSWSMMESNKAPLSTSYDRFELFKGQSVDGMSINIALNQITTGEFTIVGPGSEILTTSDPSPGTPTYTAAATNEVMDSLNNVPSVQIANVEYPVQSVSFNWANGSRPRGVVGQRTPTGVGSGAFRGSGVVTAYYDDIAEYNKALSGTLSSLLVVSRDKVGTVGNTLVFSFPAIRWGNPTRTGKTQDEQIITNLPFTIETSPTELCGVRLELFPSI